jgi:hypothetical protein
MIPVLVAALLEKGFSLLGNAVLAKGKDVIEDKLGISLEDSVKTEEGMIKLKQLEMDHEQFLIAAAQKKAETELEYVKEDNKNIASARDMNAKVQESVNASRLAKNAAYILDFIIVMSTIGLVVMLFLKAIPEDNQNLAYMAVGSLLTMCGQILNFHRGSTALSKGKDTAIEQLTQLKDRRNEPRS